MVPRETPRYVRSVWPPLVLMGLGAGYALWAQDYSRTPRLMPTLTGSGIVLLSVLDLLSRFDTRLGAILRLALGADFNRREMSHDPAFRDEVVMTLWMMGCIAMMLVIGILPAVPIFVAGYMVFWGGQSWLRAGLSALVVLAFVVGVFEVLLDYRLYRGALFDPKGFAGW